MKKKKKDRMNQGIQDKYFKNTGLEAKESEA